MQSLFKNIITKTTIRETEKPPLNRLDKSVASSDKLPWIVKKTVLVDEKGNQLDDAAMKRRYATGLPCHSLKEPKKVNILPESVNSFCRDEEDSTNPFEYNPVIHTEKLSFAEESDFHQEEVDYFNNNIEDDDFPVIENYKPTGIISEKNSASANQTEELNCKESISGSNEIVKTNRIKIIEEGVSPDSEEQFISGVNRTIAADSGKMKETERNSGKNLYQIEKERQIKALEDKKNEKVFGDIEVNKDYIVPMHFLNMTKESNEESWQSEIRKNSQLLVKTLGDFGIECKVVKVNRGPVITLYEMQIAPGIKVTRIVSLSDDIAMALAASRVRVVAPIPGKSAVGVEVPNLHRESVTLGDILKSEEHAACNMVLKVALGKDILGKPVMLDLKKQPHLLIAGATGAGKSVLVNTIISSLVFNYDPSVIRFIMIDPKMVELQLYNGMPHQLCEVITEPDLSPRALKWAILEMERRYRLLSEHGTRDIERFNQKMESHRRKDEVEKLPYIIIIIDELADLMMVAPKEIENYITRIAQKARAVGIHLIIATQRPSVDVITGVIKANFPARIAFQVAQKNDSRTIIDQNGAEKLLGKGDMLYQSPMSSFPVRIQGAYISEDEIIQIVQHAKSFGRPKYIDIEETINEYDELAAASGEDEDDLFVEALQIIEETRKASASYLQRRLSIGYNRAARIIERMEELGYIGSAQGSKPREILI
ncbi:MAG: DNA translocase FtsK [Spirochaetes bacterium]|nr:DNA translocase FtsK [Spirochaetota bacterium]